MKEDVEVYHITGRQLGPISVPATWCEECDLTVREVRAAVAHLDPEGVLQVQVRPWLRHAVRALAAGGWHPPVVLLAGRLFSQGIVPDRTALRDRISALLVAGRTGAEGGTR